MLSSPGSSRFQKDFPKNLAIYIHNSHLYGYKFNNTHKKFVQERIFPGAWFILCLLLVLVSSLDGSDGFIMAVEARVALQSQGDLPQSSKQIQPAEILTEAFPSLAESQYNLKTFLRPVISIIVDTEHIHSFMLMLSHVQLFATPWTTAASKIITQIQTSL